MRPQDKRLETHIKDGLRRKNAYFDRYISFKHTCMEKGISDEEIPMLWIAYHLNEIEYGMR